MKLFLKLTFAIMMTANVASAFQTNLDSSKSQVNSKANRVADGVDFGEWEADFDNSMDKAKSRVEKCELKSQNCKFEKYQALDPDFEKVH